MGTFVRAGLAVAVLACVAGADGPKEDSDRLKGTWVSRGPDHELQIQYLQIVWDGSGAVME